MQWKIPLADLDYDAQETAAAVDVLRSKWLTMGSVTQRFEARFADLVGAKHAFAVANCTAGLHLALAALDIGPGDEVIVPSLTFVATANAVLYTGATPVFADITSLEDLTLSPSDVERHLTERTRAIVVMHYGGYPCAMQEIGEIAQQHSLAIVEDAAHAPGSAIDGRMAGTLGDVGCFSFFSNKNLATGEGGMVVTDRDDLAERLRVMRSHGMTALTWDRHQGHAHSYDVVDLGYNYRIDEIRSALGLVQLDKLVRNNRQRHELVAEYRLLFAGIPGLVMPFGQHPGTSACHLAAVILGEHVDRRLVIERLRELGIQTSIHYPPIHQFSYYQQRLGTTSGMLPLTETVGLREITLPLYPGMTNGDVKTVADALRSALEEE